MANHNNTTFADANHAEKLITAATEAANVALWSIDPKTGTTWFSDVWYTMLGYEAGAFTPSFDVFIQMMHPDDHIPTIAAYEDLIEGRTGIYSADFRLRDASGQWRWIGATGAKVTPPESSEFLVYGMQMDISERKLVEAELAETADNAQEHRQRLSRLAENSPAALFEFRIDSEGTVTLPYMTTGVYELLGVPPEQVEGDGLTVFQNILPEDMEKMGPAIEKSRVELTPFRLRYRVLHPDKGGDVTWVQANSAPHREADGSTVWFGSVYDATPEVEREVMLAKARDGAIAMEEEMRKLALQDGLTGLPNRRVLDERLKNRVKGPYTSAPNAVLIRIDLDRFKFVNDTLGHPAGDAVLVHVAHILQASIGIDDLPCRVGGDEFCILMAQGQTEADAKAVVNKIQNQLRVPFVFEGKTCRFGASFGIASSSRCEIGNGDLMSFADVALYEAKAAGRGKLRVFSQRLHDRILEGRRLASELEDAIENREFEPFFQPQVCAHTGQFYGLEVLARWCRSSGETLSPDRFMDIAEQIRAVPLIDKLMMDKTYSALVHWKEQGFKPPKIAFNLSAGRLRDNSIVEAARNIQKLDVQVGFELLESILLEEGDGSVDFTLDLAREAGIQIEIDDFGTGHASILGVLQVKPDILKIDKRLTANVEDFEQSRELVGSIVGIAKTLGIQSIAEGVETQHQAEVLSQIGCDFLQGYLYAPPLNTAETLEWSRSHASLKPRLQWQG